MGELVNLKENVLTTNQIEAGYRLTVTSWENDGDNYNTKTVEGYTLEEVTFLVELCNLFRSRNQVKGCIGNMYEPSDKELQESEKAVLNVVSKHPISQTSDKLRDYFDTCNDDYFGGGVMEYMDNLGFSCGNLHRPLCLLSFCHIVLNTPERQSQSGKNRPR